MFGFCHLGHPLALIYRAIMAARPRRGRADTAPAIYHRGLCGLLLWKVLPGMLAVMPKLIARA